jgi:hypothetical protein
LQRLQPVLAHCGSGTASQRQTQGIVCRRRARARASGRRPNWRRGGGPSRCCQLTEAFARCCNTARWCSRRFAQSGGFVCASAVQQVDRSCRSGRHIDARHAPPSRQASQRTPHWLG